MAQLRIGKQAAVLLGSWAVMQCAALQFAATASASDADVIGATALQAAQPSLTGSGVYVIQAEGEVSTNAFEVNPANAGLPTNIFTYVGTSGSIATGYPNGVGLDSWHADSVATVLAGIAPGVSGIDNYDANFYYPSVVAAGVTPSSIDPSLQNAEIVNQSFVFTGAPDPSIDQQYDFYANKYNVLFISGAGNSGYPQSPSTAYNGISVNAQYMSPPTVGPTTDGRSKPDLTGPENETSYATPDVTGAAALLLQAVNENQGGPGTAAAAGDIRVMKALLLNGAVKPAGWSHTSTAPLDPFWGSGVVNVYNSWQELTSGRQTVSAAIPTGQLQAPVGLVLSTGWDLGSLPGAGTTNHYFFTAPSNSAGGDTLTATLDWNVSDWDADNNAIFNNLYLALYDASNPSSLVSISDSTVDNLQQLYVSGLVPGDTYDMQVYEPAAVVNGGAETYGLAYSVAVPEPATLLLLAVAGAFGMAVYVRRRRRPSHQ